MKSLFQRVAQLVRVRPDLRPHLVPLLQKAASEPVPVRVQGSPIEYRGEPQAIARALRSFGVPEDRVRILAPVFATEITLSNAEVNKLLRVKAITRLVPLPPKVPEMTYERARRMYERLVRTAVAEARDAARDLLSSYSEDQMDGDLGVNMDLATGSYESHAAEFKDLLPWLRTTRAQTIRIIAEQI